MDNNEQMIAALQRELGAAAWEIGRVKALAMRLRAALVSGEGRDAVLRESEFLASPEQAAPVVDFSHLAGRGMHELRTDELPAYLVSVGVGYGPRSAEFVEAATWVASELERKTNDERGLAVQLAEIREATPTPSAETISAHPAPAAGLHQVPVTTYLAPDGVTHWPAYSHEQREAYALAILAQQPTQAPAVPDVKKMVDRFLGWPIPKSFSPDCGISFKPIDHLSMWPTGTNLLTADEARQMFEHVLTEQEPRQKIFKSRAEIAQIARETGWSFGDTPAAVPAAQAVAVPEGFPAGALHNGEVFANQLENIYDFECQAGPLRNCTEWIELRRCLRYIADYLAAPPATHEGKAGDGLDKLYSGIINLPRGRFEPANASWRAGYDIGHRDARHAAAELVAAMQAQQAEKAGA